MNPQSDSKIERTLADLRARQRAGEHMPCPRCGRDTMNVSVNRNALSRYADILICSECGLGESILDYMGLPLSLPAWACFKHED